MPPLPQVILVHRILNFHPEVDVVHEDLLEDLRLLVRARAADGHVEATPLEHESGVQGVHRPLAWVDPVHVVRVQGIILGPILQEDPGIPGGDPTTSSARVSQEMWLWQSRTPPSRPGGRMSFCD